MRFTSILLAALPLIGCAFAAPLEMEKRDVAPARLVEKSTDVLSVIADLKADITAITPITSLSTAAQVEACLTVVIGALQTCGDALGIDLTLGVDADITVDIDVALTVSEKAQIAADLEVVINLIVTKCVGPINVLVQLDATVAALLSEVDVALNSILCSLESIISGLLTLVSSLLGIVLTLVESLLGGSGSSLCGC